MDKIENIKDFRDIFVNNISTVLSKECYKYKSSKYLFEKIFEFSIFRINVYYYKRPTFIEIETKAYYGNKNIENKLKNNEIKVLNDTICGGDLRFICEYYFNKKFPEKYSNLIYELNEPVQPLIEKWIKYFNNIIKPFFKDCLDPIKLNKIVNEERINTTGLNLNYENRVLKFYYIGKEAGLNDNKLKELSILYKNEMEKFNAKYLNKYMELIKKELGDI